MIDTCDAHNEGFAEGFSGGILADCPHEEGTEKYNAWKRGYLKGEYEITGENAGR
jgi:hypothetical protein